MIEQGNIYLGIDPGMNGGIVVLGARLQPIQFELSDNEFAVWTFLETYSSKRNLLREGQPKTIAVIERISTAIFGIKKSDMSKLYGSYTSLRMAMVGNGIDFSEKLGKDWQREMGIEKRRKNESDTMWKARLMSIAHNLYPRTTFTKATADAVLIATYCKMKHESNLPSLRK